MSDLRNVADCEKEIRYKRSETMEATDMKRLLCKLGKKLDFFVDVEEKPESELGDLGIRHDVLWYTEPPFWYRKLLEKALSRDDLDSEYRDLVNERIKMSRLLYVAFEVEATDQTTKGMKGDISNLSKLPYGVVVVKRGKKEAQRGWEAIRNRFEKALLEFRKLHGPNNVLIVSFEDIESLAEDLSIKI